MQIDNYTWSTWFDQNEFPPYISAQSPKYTYLIEHVINRIYPILLVKDAKLLLDALVIVLNFLHRKFSLNDDIFWNQLIQNDNLDLRAILNLLLPHIEDDEIDTKKHSLQAINDLYMKTKNDGSFVYTNCQYNRCIRQGSLKNSIIIKYRPLIHLYLVQNIQLLLYSIESSTNKLYVNRIDILPIPLDTYEQTPLFQNTQKKINLTKLSLISTHIDPLPGLSFQDIYNTISVNLFHRIKSYKILMFDIIYNSKPIQYIDYLEQKIDFTKISTQWSQLTLSSRDKFTSQWKNFFFSTDQSDQLIIGKLYFFFAKYHINSQKLIRANQLILTSDIVDADDIEEDTKITPKKTADAKKGMINVPVEEIYLFFFNQIKNFRSSWYYHQKSKISEFIFKGKTIFITRKYFYNYSKSLISYVPYPNAFVQYPKLWVELNPSQISVILSRLLNVTDPTWFNINKYIRRMYPEFEESDLPEINYLIHLEIRKKLINVIFESLIYSGILSVFAPAPSITNSKKIIFSDPMLPHYRDKSFYFVTSEPYGKSFFEYLQSEDQDWTFTYAMNWVSQINFYHHYINNRIIYVTGSTGVGKSTQIPKLIMYAEKMLDWNFSGKIICSQPRISPTVLNATIISEQMGVPIVEKNILYDSLVPTSNFYVQFKHSEGSHVSDSVESYLRIVTDGTLLEQVIKSPFMTMTRDDPSAIDSSDKAVPRAKTYTSTNIYDCVIVDEAHEHNPNMDIILTLVRDSVYVNNSIKLVIISATMEDDEPIYRRYYRTINDNRANPLSMHIQLNNMDRANVDRRIHISQPGATTKYKIIDHYLSESESNEITTENFVKKGIELTQKVISTTTRGDLLLFMTGQSDIIVSVSILNETTPSNVIAFGFYRQLSEERRKFIQDIHLFLPSYTRFKEDTDLDESQITRRVPLRTYTRAIIVATNVAEASITLRNLIYVVDTGYAKVNIYDPLEQIYKMITLPISKSSSTQRRGRVGRKQAGEVYYLYSKSKLSNNKTAYKIADINIKDIILKLIRSDPADTPIISPINDVNDLPKLTKVMKKEIIPELQSKLLSNPKPYSQILTQKYLLSPDPNDLFQYYNYFGVSAPLEENDLFFSSEIKNNFASYLRLNHDDYHYQKNYGFNSRGYTGYNATVLEDNKLEFYLIHPEENIINRDPFTGKLKSLKFSPSVSSGYFYYLLNVNTGSGNSKNIDYDNFVFLKYYLAEDNAKFQLLLIDSVPDIVNTDIFYLTNKPEENFLLKPYNEYSSEYNHQKSSTIKSNLLTKLNNLGISTNIVSNTNDLLWYAFSLAEGEGVEEDVIAIIIMMKTLITPSAAMTKDNYYAENVKKFLLTNSNNQGDLYFLWIIWNQIKDILIKNQIYQTLKITNETQARFIRNKNLYLEGKKMELKEYLLFTRLDMEGKLNTIDEYYHWVEGMNPEVKNIEIEADIKFMAKNYKLDPIKMMEFVKIYMEEIFDLNRKIWIYEYMIKNSLSEDTMTNVIDWMKKTLKLPTIITDELPTHLRTPYDRILESYIRAYGINLIKNEGNQTYLKLNNGLYMKASTFGPKLTMEKTLFNMGRTEYMIYHNEETIKGNVSPIFLTGVKLDWVLETNPIYYYNLLFDETNVLAYAEENSGVNRSKEILAEAKNKFSFKFLNEYLSQIVKN